MTRHSNISKFHTYTLEKLIKLFNEGFVHWPICQESYDAVCTMVINMRLEYDTIKEEAIKSGYCINKHTSSSRIESRLNRWRVGSNLLDSILTHPDWIAAHPPVNRNKNEMLIRFGIDEVRVKVDEQLEEVV